MYVCNCIKRPMQSVHSTIVYNSKRKPETIQIPIVNLLKEKDKWFSQQNRAYSGIAEKSNYNSGQANYDKPRASPENKGKEYSFIEERRKLVGAVLNNNSQEENKGSKFWWLLIDWDVAASHWLGCCWAKRKIFLRAGEYVK